VEVDYYQWRDENYRAIAAWEDVAVLSRALYISLDNGVLGDDHKPSEEKSEEFGMGSSGESVAQSDWTYGEVRKIYDSAPPQQRLKALAEFLGTDARTAYKIHQMALNDQDAQTWSDFAKTAENLEKARKTIITGSKIGVMICSAMLTGGTTTFLQGTAMVIQGADLALEITETGAFVVMGDQSESTTVVKYVKQAREYSEPAAAISGVLTLNFRNLKNLKGKTFYSDLDYDTAMQVLQMELTAAALTTDYIAEDKVLGIKIKKDENKQNTSQVERVDFPSYDLEQYAYMSGINPNIFFDFPIQVRAWNVPPLPFEEFIKEYRKWVVEGYQQTSPPVRPTHEPDAPVYTEPPQQNPQIYDAQLTGQWKYAGHGYAKNGVLVIVEDFSDQEADPWFEFYDNGTLKDFNGASWQYFIEEGNERYANVVRFTDANFRDYYKNDHMGLGYDGRLYLVDASGDEYYKDTFKMFVKIQ